MLVSPYPSRFSFFAILVTCPMCDLSCRFHLGGDLATLDIFVSTFPLSLLAAGRFGFLAMLTMITSLRKALPLATGEVRYGAVTFMYLLRNVCPVLRQRSPPLGI